MQIFRSVTEGVAHVGTCVKMAFNGKQPKWISFPKMHAQDVRELYKRKLERANNLYMELCACMLQMEKRERELAKREQALLLYERRRRASMRSTLTKSYERYERI